MVNFPKKVFYNLKVSFLIKVIPKKILQKNSQEKFRGGGI